MSNPGATFPLLWFRTFLNTFLVTIPSVHCSIFITIGDRWNLFIQNAFGLCPASTFPAIPRLRLARCGLFDLSVENFPGLVPICLEKTKTRWKNGRVYRFYAFWCWMTLYHSRMLLEACGVVISQPTTSHGRIPMWKIKRELNDLPNAP